METDTIKITKLVDQKQWTIWKFQISIILKSQDLWNLVIGVEKPPLESDKEFASLKVAYDKKDISAQRVFITTLGEQPLTHIVTCTSASEMWSKLESVFEQKSSQSIHFLQQKFFSMEKSEDDDVASFMSKMDEIVKQLSDLGTEVPQTMIMTKILTALPPSYNHFHSAWESTAEKERNLNNLRTRLMMEEKRMSLQETSEVSGALFAKKMYGKKSSYKGNDKGNKKPGKCFICSKDTHWKSDCPLRNKKPSSALMTEIAEIDECMLTCDYDTSWFNDSGTTKHMSKQREWFRDYVQLAIPHPVRIGNGELIYALGKGNIDILAFNGVNWIKRYLSNAFYVPKLHTNLFAQGVTCDKGCIFISDNEQCEFIKIDSGEVVAMGVRETGGLFQMLICRSEETESANVAACDSLSVWHQRLAHQNVAHVKRFLQQRNIQFNDEKFQCEPCIYGKQHRSSFMKREEKEKECGAIIHADVCGYFDKQSFGGAKYFLLLKDDYSHFRTVYFLKQKSEVASRIKQFVNLAKNQTQHSIKVLRSDNGTEFVNKQLSEFYADLGIKQQTTVPYTPEQNGTVERENRTIVEAARTLLHAHGLDQRLWAEAVNASVYVLNCTGTSTIKGKTPHQLWYNKDANIDKLKEFGSIVYAHIPKQKRKKFDKKSTKCVLVGYCDNGYRVFDPQTKKVVASRDLIFAKNELIAKEKCNDIQKLVEKEPNTAILQKANKNEENYEQESVILKFFKLKENYTNDCVTSEVDEKENETEAPTETPTNENVTQSIDFDSTITNVSSENGALNISNISNISSENENNSTLNQTVINNSNADLLNSTAISEVPENNAGRSAICNLTQRNVIDSRLRSQAASIDSIMLAIYEPKTCEDAMQTAEKDQWAEAMREEIASLNKNNTWVLTELPQGEKAIDNRWVFKVKMNPDDSLERFKARLVVKGFSQQYGVNYTETFSPVVRYSSVRSILATAAKNKMVLKQFDIKTAFLYGDLDETVYMKQPDGFSDGTNKVCKLLKSLYGLKQASRCWNQKFTHFIKEFDFVQSENDPCVFIRKVNGETVILAIYVDDGLLAATNESCFRPVIDYLRKHFEVKEFEAKCYLGLMIEQRIDGTIEINQQQYTKRIIEKFGMQDAHASSTPMDNHRVLDAVGTGETVVFPYREAVGSLAYLAKGTRPDICFAVNYVSRYQEQPTALHTVAVKRIFKYLKGTLNFGLVFFSNTNFDVRCYSDSDYAGCLDTRKSTTGYCITMGGSLLSWCSERQSSVSRSTAEAEYIASSEAVGELVWLTRLLKELIGPITPVLMADNSSACKMIRSSEAHKRTKHIDVHYHFVRHRYDKKEFTIQEVSSHEQLADILTKPMPKIRIEFLRDSLNIKQL